MGGESAFPNKGASGRRGRLFSAQAAGRGSSRAPAAQPAATACKKAKSRPECSGSCSFLLRCAAVALLAAWGRRDGGGGGFANAFTLSSLPAPPSRPNFRSIVVMKEGGVETAATGASDSTDWPRAKRWGAARVSRLREGVQYYTSRSLGLSFGSLRPRNSKLVVSAPETNVTVGGSKVEEAGENMRKKILILISDTGGGHRASAEALKAAFDMEYPGLVDIDVVDIWTDYGPWPYNKFVESYQYMAKRPILWRGLWHWAIFPPTRWLTLALAHLRCFRGFRRCLEQCNPDLIVSVHPLCQDLPLRVLDKIGEGYRRTPFVTVVTDLGAAHPTWFNSAVDKCFVPSRVLWDEGIKRGLSSEQLVLHGLPIRPGFWQDSKSDKFSLRRDLGLQEDLKTCLIVGGGDGVGGLESIARKVVDRLAKLPRETQVVVVCGKNEVVQKSLNRSNFPSNVKVHVKGFVKNMDEWMGASDCIVTKAGPGTIAEATIRGLPIMLSTFLPGQESGNVPYVTDGGFGAFSKKPGVIADTVSQWLADDAKLQSMSEAAKRVARPLATALIARDIGTALFGGSMKIE